MKKLTILLIGLTVLVTVVPAMAARDVGEIAQGATEQANYLGIALIAIAAVIGIGCIINGAMRIWKATKGRGDATVGGGIGAIVVGVLLMCIVAVGASGSKSVFGDEDSMSEIVSDFE